MEKFCHDFFCKMNDPAASTRRGKYSFELFLMYSFRNCTLPVEHHEALNWLAASALAGHNEAFLVGRRVFAAHSLPLPKVMRDGPQCDGFRSELHFLENLPPNEFYSNAVRIYWTKAWRVLAPNLLNIPDRLRGKPIGMQLAHCEGMTDDEFWEHANRYLFLHQAILQDNEQVIADLISRGCDINIQTENGLTPLHLACRLASHSIIYMLLSLKADASLNDNTKVSPLHWIILLPKSEIPHIATLLIQQGAQLGVGYDGADCSYFFDALGLQVTGSPLSWACQSCNATAVEVLSSLIVQIDCQSSFKLLRCAVAEVLGLLRADIFEIILNASNFLQNSLIDDDQWDWIGAGPRNDMQRWCIHGESYNKAHSETADAFLRAGGVIPISPPLSTQRIGFSPLSRAALSFKHVLVQEYLTRGADVNEREWPSGRTALGQAIVYCAEQSTSNPAMITKTIEVLIDHGASFEREKDPPKSRKASPSILYLAAMAEYLPLTAFHLLVERAQSFVDEITTSDTFIPGYTLLHCVISSHPPEGFVERVGILLDYGVNPNIESLHDDHATVMYSCCRTALSDALNRLHWDVAEILLDRGCSTSTGISGGHRHTVCHLMIWRSYLNQELPPEDANDKVQSIFHKLLDHPIVRSLNLVNEPDFRGNTPLQLAIHLGVPHCVNILLDHGCSLETATGDEHVMSLLDRLFLHPPLFVYDENVNSKPIESHADYLPPRKRSEYKKSLALIYQMLGCIPPRDVRTARAYSEPKAELDFRMEGRTPFENSVRSSRYRERLTQFYNGGRVCRSAFNIGLIE